MSNNSGGKGRVLEHPSKKNAIRTRRRFNIYKSKLPFVFLILLMFYVSFSFGVRFNDIYAMQQDVRDMQEQVELLKERNQQLSHQLEMVQSETYVEEVAREKLGLVKAGETRIVPVED